MMAAAADANRRENEEKYKRLKDYFDEWEEMPDFLIYASYTSKELSYKWKELLSELESMNNYRKTFEEKKQIVKERVKELALQEKAYYEEEWGWDKRQAKLSRTIYWDIKLKLLSDKYTQRLYNLLKNNADILRSEVGNALPKSEEETASYIRHCNDLFKANKWYAYGVLNYADQIVWEISLTPYKLDDRCADVIRNMDICMKRIYEMGFRIGSEYTNQWYMKKAGNLIQDLAFNELEADYMIINTNKKNTPANALAETLWFSKEPQNINNEKDKNTWSKSTQWIISSFLLGKKFLTRKLDESYKNL